MGDGHESGHLATLEWTAPDNNPALGSAFHTVYRLSKLPSFSSTNIVCTLGPLGVLASIKSLLSPIYVPASILQGEIRDSTGAGDCFTGYLAVGLMELFKKAAVGRDDYLIILRRCVQVGISRQFSRDQLLNNYATGGRDVRRETRRNGGHPWA